MAMPSPSPRRGLTFVFPAFAAALLLAGCASTGGLAPREHPIEADSLASGRSLDVPALSDAAFPARDWWTALGRSEEHTSELQSLMRNSYAVFCLKTKQKHNSDIKTRTEQISER